MAQAKERTESYCEETKVTDSAQECALVGAIAAIAGLKGSAALVHSPPGCAWTSRWARSDFALTYYMPLIASNILQHNIVFGALDKLREVSRWALAKWHPKQLFLITTCTSSLISDPMDEVAVELEKEFGLPVLVLEGAGFTGLSPTGADEAYVKLLARFAKDEVKRKEGSVNLIAPSLMGSANWVYDLAEMKRLLEAIDIPVNCVLTHDTSMEELEGFNRAEANIYLTYEELPALRRYESAHNLERLGQDLPIPIGAANMDKWYPKIAERFGKEKEAEKVIWEEIDQIKFLKFHYNNTWLSTWMGGKYLGVVGPATWAASFANFMFYDMGSFPAVIALYGDSPESIERAKETISGIKESYDPIVLENPLYIQLVDALKEKDPEFVVGQTQDKSLVESYGYPHLTMAGNQTVFGSFNFIPYPSTGIRGILYLLTQLGRILEKAFHEPGRWQDLSFQGRERTRKEEDHQPL
jgi:nitrogenase molybdenum-iron protein alpha/beta subunit